MIPDARRFEKNKKVFNVRFHKSFRVNHRKAGVKVPGARMFFRCLLAIVLKMVATLTTADTVTCRMAPRRNIVSVQLG